MSMNIEYVGRDAMVDTPDVAFTYQVSETITWLHKLKGKSNDLDWNNQHKLQDYLVYPFGANNDLPDIISILFKPTISLLVLKKKTQLIWGLGPQLYNEDIEDRVLVRNWVKDTIK
jgi:hypothetical protein